MNSDQRRHYRDQTSTEFTGRGAGGEGLSQLPNRLLYSLTHAKPIPQNLIPRYSQDFVPKIRQKLITSFVMLHARFREVVSTIDFHDQLQFDTAKVRGMRWLWAYAAKFHAASYNGLDFGERGARFRFLIYFTTFGHISAATR